MDAPDIDDLVAQFSRGERDPKVLHALNVLAWETFHDPWEKPPALIKHRLLPYLENIAEIDSALDDILDDLEETPQPEVEPAPSLPPVTLDRIQRHLTCYGEPTVHHRDTHLGMALEMAGRPVTLRVCLQGRGRKVLEMTFRDDRHIPPARVQEAVSLCNLWNSRNPWPRAFLRLAPRPVNPSRLYLDAHFDLQDGISDRALQTLLQSQISSSQDFWALALKSLQI